MKNKNEINEASSYPTNNAPTTSTSSINGTKATTVMVQEPDLKKTVADLKGSEANIMVTNEELGSTTKLPGKLDYLSEVKDDAGQVSKPFTINGKQYQMVRAITSERKKVMGVYSIDERDEEGKNIIYDLKEFEENVAKKYLNENPEDETQLPTNTGGDQQMNYFEGHKHFIVNEKSGRVRKFKDTNELAAAKMAKGEKYMGLKEFKKFLEATLFGKKQKPIEEDVPATPPVQEPAAVTHMFDLIDHALPKDVYDNIKQNPTAQEAAINNWIGRIGVPADKLNNIIATLRNAAKTPASTTSTSTSVSSAPVSSAPVSEGKNILRTIKVKDI